MNIAKQTIIFFGPQGSGKGTQIALLEARLVERFPEDDVVNVQTGRRFRALAAMSEGYTETSVAETLDSGTLQPLFLSVSLWGDAMRTHVNPETHLLMDGFPRTVAEATVLESALSFYKRTELTIINLATPEDVVRERMVKRARADDTLSSIEARLAWYAKETQPLLEYYKARPDTHVIDIDGTQTIEAIHTEILNKLNI